MECQNAILFTKESFNYVVYLKINCLHALTTGPVCLKLLSINLEIGYSHGLK